ncbi:MAG: plasmid pRiA4b ORF-3 family protein, partial [Hyphomicrobium sp.]
ALLPVRRPDEGPPMARSTPSGANVVRLTLRLRECEPPIWRTILVRNSTSLHQLHLAIQKAMGWTNSHLYEFEVRKSKYTDLTTVDYFEDDEQSEDARTTKLSLLKLERGESFTYLYDFGDYWLHDITVDSIESPIPGASYPNCVAGARACPPEDCGGTHGYFEFLEAITDTTHPEHESYLVWVGGNFDPEAFDLASVNQLLSRRSRRTDRGLAV